MRRRDFFPAMAAIGTAAAQDAPVQRKGRLKQTVTRGVFRGMDFEESCKIAAKFGCKGYDLIGPKDGRPSRSTA